jgi:cob(I)alamin adenosyltransferase
MRLEEAIDAVLGHVQDDLFSLGAELACTPGRESKLSVTLLGADDIGRLEHFIDDAVSACPPLDSFILPGGTSAAAALHLARTVCRRAERAVLAIDDDVKPRWDVVIYLNRLSDLLFALARRANVGAGVADVRWNPRHRD